MITNNILVDSEKDKNLGGKIQYIPESPAPIIKYNHNEESAEKKPTLFVKGGVIGYLLILLELVGTCFAVLLGLAYLSYKLNTWAILIGGIIGLFLIFWAMSNLPKRAKEFVIYSYLRIHVFLFMVGLGGSGYFLAKLNNAGSFGEVIIFTIITAVPAFVTHVPYLRKSNLYSLL